ncbi:MAG TPA: YncE family protein [Chitinophagaceae bacterium]|nr:YncE family protein [Chitinophagaceae bacterium]
MPMQSLLSYFTLFFITVSCQNASIKTNPVNDSLARAVLKKYSTEAKRDTVPSAIPLKPYSALKYEKKETLTAALGTKSVIFNSKGSKLYAMNLEGMSVYEFDQATRQISREFKFTPTRGTGWDYNRSRPIASFQEKPVEACLSHDDEILWVSLHNAEGIIPIWLDDFSKNRKSDDPDQKVKPVTVIYPGSSKKDTFYVPLIETGKTPKVIARTADSKYLLVSNWHSHTTSVLALNKDEYPYGKVISTVPASAIPRGVVVDDKNKKSYVAIMGGASLSVINNNTWEKEGTLNVLSNPRHVVMDTSGHLFVSYNKLATIACLDAATGESLFSAKTHSQPRTIVLSKNYKFIFVTCYSGDFVDVYKINDDNFEKVASLPCDGHPVGADIFENDDTLEAWVCSYSNGRINIYTFKKK